MKRATVFLFLVGLAPFLVAQEEKKTKVPEDFATIYATWKATDAKINDIVADYRVANAAKRKELLTEYQSLASESAKMIPKLREAGIAAYKAGPNKNDNVTSTLVGLVANDVRQDEYDSALELAALLLENDCQEASLDTFAGIAAYCTDDFASAERYLARAKAADVLTPTAQVCLDDLDMAKKLWTAEEAIRKREAKADDLPRVKLETNKGTIVIELYENEAPGAVGNFVSLVEKKFYDGLTFHRVLPGFMAQGGCPDGTGGGGPDYKIYCECGQDNHRKHFRGSLSMAHAGQHTGGSQFFLTFKRTSHLDGKHTVFGRIIEGLDVLGQIQRRNPNQGGAPDPDQIVRAEVIRKREHEYQPNKVSNEEK